MKIAILGLGKMGSRIAEKLLSGGHEVFVWNRSEDVLNKFKEGKGKDAKGKLRAIYSISDFRNVLTKPRVFWLMLPAGEATESIISEIKEIAEKGDIVIDGGNAHFKDTQRRYDELTLRGIKFLGIGVSGGVHGLNRGFCIMAGGDKEGYEYVKPALVTLARPGGGYNYFGIGGAGHFVKMVHNGIEYGMMQAIGEGFGVLEKSAYGFNLLDVGHIYQQGSIVRSFLMEMGVNAISEDPGLSSITGVISATGEGKWTIEQGHEERVPVDVIEKSLEFRERSQEDKEIQNSFAAKLVAAMRKQFGGHEIKKLRNEN